MKSKETPSKKSATIIVTSPAVEDVYVRTQGMKGLAKMFHWNVRKFLRKMKYFKYEKPRQITSSEFTDFVQKAANTTTLMLFFQACEKNPFFLYAATLICGGLLFLISIVCVYSWPFISDLFLIFWNFVISFF